MIRDVKPDCTAGGVEPEGVAVAASAGTSGGVAEGWDARAAEEDAAVSSLSDSSTSLDAALRGREDASSCRGEEGEAGRWARPSTAESSSCWPCSMCFRASITSERLGVPFVAMVLEMGRRFLRE
jgi:hypothetical protein